MRLIQIAFILFFTLSCQHQEKQQREIAQTSTQKENATEDINTEKLQQIVEQKDSVRLKQYLIKFRISQSLVSAFDERLKNIKKAEDVDQLLHSNLYCKLMETRVYHEHAEQEILFIIKYVKTLNPEYNIWFYSELNEFINNIDQTHLAAIGQLIRFLKFNEQDICSRKECIDEDLKLLTHLKVNPLNARQFSTYLKKINSDIANYAIASEQSLKESLKPGDCFNQTTSFKRQTQSVDYDWAKRNWIGSVLPNGQFVFTYDDGPHPEYTQKIIDTWATAGLAKPSFFWLYKNTAKLDSVVKSVNQQNYNIGSHSYSHPDIGNLAKANSASDLNGVNKQLFATQLKSVKDFNAFKTATLDAEITQPVKALSQQLGKPVKYFRLPYGSGIKNTLIGQYFENLNVDHFFWRVDSLDWQDKNPQSILDRVLAQMATTKKGIVLFHDIHPQSAQATQLLVNYLKTNKAYKAVQLTDIPGVK